MYNVIWLFLIYSFLGWVLESIYAAVKNRRFINRGVLGGPLCAIYGLAAVIWFVFLRELTDSYVFLFLSSGIIYGVSEWTTGKLLETIFHRRYWDYSERKYHIDGLTSLRSAIYGAVIGLIGIEWLDPLLLRFLETFPSGAGHIILICTLIAAGIDAVWTYSYILGLPQRLPQTEAIHNGILRLSAHLNSWIIRHCDLRLQRAYPNARSNPAKPKTTIFAEGCSFYKIFWLFVIGAFLGDVTETIFCRITMGVWMSRSSLVWGPFSVVWGIGIAGATWGLYNYRNRSDSFLFWAGTLLGGTFEYMCSVFTELVFGQVFWDYSAIPFNLDGRINLLYCFFWGIAAVAWLKGLYPRISALIEKIPMRIGKALTVFLVLFMVSDILMSCAALVRYDARSSGQAAGNAVEEWLDEHYDDTVMQRIYPKAKSAG